MKIDRFDIVVSTDGACSGNPGPGGYAAIMRFGTHECVVRGYAPQTTNNRMELKALIESVRSLKKPCNIIFQTDSEYIINGLSHMEERRENGWRTKTGARCINAEMWQELTDLKNNNSHRFQWLRQDRGTTEDNIRCDRIAKEQIKLHRTETEERKSIEKNG